ncbi:hypothetical protein [Rhodanobacter sp. C01]|uniref:hypothetical protein n=1 Tax=Rhodanobacter sp. C01 TaxID=1945856 RepID=UPI00098460D3|nr:hypothetical protein [Rhodanobacter sp. C01]OOG51055.1 hypothetical protein B0E50_02440 [Rhodanobacter sp. C01]
MKEHHAVSADQAAVSTAGAVSAPLDWHWLAAQRLSRLVEVEHDCSVVRERLDSLQNDYRESLVARDGQLQQIRELGDRLADLAQVHARMRMEYESAQAALLGSRSWRMTRPLRMLSMQVVSARRRIGGLLRAMLRVPLLRRVARVLARLVPGLHARLRSRLYPHG